VIVDVDSFKSFYPGFVALQARHQDAADELVHGDARRWLERALTYAADRQMNVIAEHGLRDWEVTDALLTRFARAGYWIEARSSTVSIRRPRDMIASCSSAGSRANRSTAARVSRSVAGFITLHCSTRSRSMSVRCVPRAAGLVASASAETTSPSATLISEASHGPGASFPMEGTALAVDGGMAGLRLRQR
jgi:hypothetical protein